MYKDEQISLCKARLEKASKFVNEANQTLDLKMYEAAANRSYYAIFHSMRAVLALDGVDFKKHSGVIQYFQKEYIKTEIFEKEYSRIIKRAFDLRVESDYEDFYIISHEDVESQVDASIRFYQAVEEYVSKVLK